MDRFLVPAAEGLALRLGQGQRLRIITPHGRQAADFFAFSADDIGENGGEMALHRNSRCREA